MMNMFISTIILFILSMIFFFNSMFMLLINKMYIFEWLIFNFNSMKMNFILMFNFKLLMFLFLVTLISSMILMYSMSYMDLSNNFFIYRFYYLMLLFLLSMIFLILSPNMLTLLLGWDGLGLISYCLIIYYQKIQSFNSGMLTVILNRLGDASLLMIISFLTMFGSWNLFFYNMNFYILIMFFMMVFTKSAQLMFMIWLPAAMMAPTPVSSLVHSSTLVTAGIYLLINYDMMINLKYKMMILVISSLTMLMSGIMANFEMDFKKIIALSTLSQLGFMMSIYSLEMTDLTFLHLFIHAFFKSMMFMCTGSFIHYMIGSQNFRFYSGMYYLYPIKGFLLMFSLLMLCGFPFLVGFYSKDLIIEYYFLNKMSIFSIMNLILGTIFTVSYSFRIMSLLLKMNYMINLMNLKEDFIMSMSMMIILLIMLMLSKFVYNFFFIHKNINLMIIYKYFVFKMMFMGIMFSLIMKNMNLMKKIILFIKSFFMMEFMYKFFINNLMMKLIYYEFYFEKGLLEKMTGKMMNFMNNMMMTNFKMKFFYLLLIYIYFMIFFLMFF
uniref:NADH:ubiquinone reductase (H(+)-translocating) n=1 Tax=Bombus filchnerae TaxID=395525 RepID=A0A8E5HIN5_9HYME|nr:NADH dehydrogenase subunit 5 [Bombus filchnerae]QTZ18841.1 NADH dehydrogenase subunit 5 [Bombus filchnerae]WKW52608.1 NADH dehydrogenase subunit 5 [Bombus filchnerae]